MSHRCGLAIYFGLALLLLPRPAAPQECPPTSPEPRNFIVERNRYTVEVISVDDRIVRTIYRSPNGQTLLETTEFEGLFELERIDRGRRSVYRPISDLAKLFPLKPKQKLTAEFESSDPPPTVKGKIVLQVQRSDALFIGSCKYPVFVIDRMVDWVGKPPAFIRTDYYAPDLKLVIAKEFKERNGATTLNKFDRIYPAKR